MRQACGRLGFVHPPLVWFTQRSEVEEDGWLDVGVADGIHETPPGSFALHES